LKYATKAVAMTPAKAMMPTINGTAQVQVGADGIFYSIIVDF
jgi:hypothetical protein